MKKSVFILFFVLLSFTSESQITREYFFNSELQVNDSISLVLIIDRPQSNFAKRINHRIYRDTTFIRYLKENWYYEYDKKDGYTTKMCAYDMYFYSLSVDKYIYLNHLNSNCGLDKIGVENLNILVQMGEPLEVDTITKIGIWTRKQDLFRNDLTFAKYEHYKEWDNTKTKKYPIIYYDGYFKTNIKLDTNFTINKNAENFVRNITNDLKGVNWNISEYKKSPYNDNEIKIKKFVEDKKSCTVEIEVYFKASKFETFKEYNIQEINFSIANGHKLLLFYCN